MKKDIFAQQENVLTIPSWLDKDPRLIVGFTTRNGGTSRPPFSSFNLGLHVGDQEDDVIQNRKHLAQLTGIELENWVVAEQVHDNKVKKVTKSDVGSGVQSLKTAIKGMDGVYTNEDGILLTSLYADCVPLYFYSPTSRFIGLAHAGWKGTVGRIAEKMIQAWEGEGVSLNEIYVTIGPSISKACYEVNEVVIEKVRELMLPDSPFAETRKGHYQLDLKSINEQLLIRAGIQPSHILISGYCTSAQNEMFFSHRKENGKTGRMMSFIGLKRE